MYKLIIITCLWLIFSYQIYAQSSNKENITIGFIKQTREALPKLSNIELPSEDEGIEGIEQGIIDNNGTAKFLGQNFTFSAVILNVNANPLSTFNKLYSRNIHHYVVDLDANALLALADQTQDHDVFFYNIGASDDFLRTSQCRDNIYHLIPSYAMQADALAQYLVFKRWRNWFLVIGRRSADHNYAQAIRRAAKKFGAAIVKEKVWDYGPDARRTAQADVPVFTQDIDYDVLIVADTVAEFGEYLMFRTWDPKIVAGTQGLYATTWHRTHEIWGAAQMQSRFQKKFQQRMTQKDYLAWAAVRSLGEAATRTRSLNQQTLFDYLASQDFELAGYKGQKMTYRSWSHQLRQPILLVWENSLVSISPQHQFLHQFSPLDTLGYDQPETECQSL